MSQTRYAVLVVTMLGSALIGGLLTLTLLGTLASARAQATFPEGAFVQGQDETRWVVGNGRRFRMAFVSDDAGRLPTLPEGGIVASACEASAAVAGTDPVACAAPRPVVVVPPAPPFAPPVLAPAAPPGVPVPDSTLLLDAYGTYTVTRPSPGPGFGPGSVVTQTFVNSAPRELELCWELADPATVNAFASFMVWERAADGDRATDFSAPFNHTPGCLTFPGRLLPAGTYVVHVTSSFQSWRVTVRVRQVGGWQWRQ